MAIKMLPKWLGIVSFLALLYGCAAPAAPQNTLVLRNGLLIDGAGAEPLPNAVVVIQGERITAVGASDAIEIPPGARVIDLQGAVILPGFINAHVHYAYDKKNLQAWAYGGVTTVRDEGIISSSANDLKKYLAQRDANNQNPKYARVAAAGYMITVPGGYGSLFVNSPEEARQQTLAELDAGVDLIKISLEDGYAGTTGLPKLSDEEIGAIITAAHERGKRVSGHITQARYLQILAAAGVDDIAHIAYDPVAAEAWATMVSKNIYLVPTFTVLRNYGAPIANCTANLENFLAQGGQAALGSDYGGGPGDFELGIPMYEIEQMSAAGMSPMQIILASTRNAAIVSGIEQETGTLVAGKLADILVVAQNPLDDLQNLRAIQMVIHGGTIIRSELLQP